MVSDRHCFQRCSQFSYFNDSKRLGVFSGSLVRIKAHLQIMDVSSTSPNASGFFHLSEFFIPEIDTFSTKLLALPYTASTFTTYTTAYTMNRR